MYLVTMTIVWDNIFLSSAQIHQQNQCWFLSTGVLWKNLSVNEIQTRFVFMTMHLKMSFAQSWGFCKNNRVLIIFDPLKIYFDYSECSVLRNITETSMYINWFLINVISTYFCLEAIHTICRRITHLCFQTNWNSSDVLFPRHMAPDM